MDFNSKKYQIFKFKNYLKEKDFLIFHCAKTNLKQWTVIEQNLKKLKLKYYKPLNGISLKVLMHSKYRHFNCLISGPVLFIEYDLKVLENDWSFVLKNLAPEFVLVSVKLSNNLYLTHNLKHLQTLNYKSNKGNLCRVMDNVLSASYLAC